MKNDTSPESIRFSNEGEEPPPPPYNTKLDPDNAASPLPVEEREEEGRRLFYPEGGPEDPKTRSFDEEYSS